MAKVIIDAGHGGREPGAIYGDRKEKDDTLRLALAVGEILKQNGVDVAFTRTEDVYNSPFEKAQIANREGGDFLISIHRNASPEPNQYSGVESLVFDRDFEGIAEAIAKGILETLREDTKVQEVKWENTQAKGNEPASETMISGERNWNTDDRNRGVKWMEDGSQTGTMKRMAGEDVRMMPERTDSRRQEPENQSWQMQCGCCTQERLYRVQTGAFRNREYAQEMLEKLLSEGFPAFLLLEDRLYKVQVGAYRMLDNAVRMEKSLRDAGYATFITT